MCPNDFGEPMNRLAGWIAFPVRIVLAALTGKIQRGASNLGRRNLKRGAQSCAGSSAAALRP